MSEQIAAYFACRRKLLIFNALLQQCPWWGKINQQHTWFRVKVSERHWRQEALPATTAAARAGGGGRDRSVNRPRRSTDGVSTQTCALRRCTACSPSRSGKGSPISIALGCLAVQEQPWASVCWAEPSKQPELVYKVCKAVVGIGSPLCPSSPLPATSPTLPQPGTQPWPLAPWLHTAGRYFWTAWNS